MLKEKWIGEEEAAMVTAMDQLGEVVEEESQRIRLFLHDAPAR